MKHLLFFFTIILITFMLSSCPKQKVETVPGGSSPGATAFVSQHPILTQTKLKECIDEEPTGFIKSPISKGEMNFGVYYHKANDFKGKYNAPILVDNFDSNSGYYKAIETGFDFYLPELPKYDLFIGGREVVDSKVFKYARMINAVEHRDIITKIHTMGLLSLTKPDHIEFTNLKYYDDHKTEDYTLVEIGTTFVSSGYPEDKVRVEAFVKWLEDKYWSTIAKEENIVKYFPWDNVNAPRPEKY